MSDELASDTCGCFRDLPATDKISPRPVYARYSRRLRGFLPGPPSEEEKSDAIRVLAEADLWADAITQEAERIFAEASA